LEPKDHRSRAGDVKYPFLSVDGEYALDEPATARGYRRETSRAQMSSAARPSSVPAELPSNGMPMDVAFKGGGEGRPVRTGQHLGRRHRGMVEEVREGHGQSAQ
jgi:hypothetical protein